MSLSGADFIAALEGRGFDFFTGVPCSLLKSAFAALELKAERSYWIATREDEAVGLAAGAFLAGRRPVVLMQNSGLGNAINAIGSLSQIYQLPFLLVISWRGHEGRDAPEHLVMGRAMTAIFEALDLPYQTLDAARLPAQLDQAELEFQSGLPSALIVRKGDLA